MEKGVTQGCVISSILFNLYSEFMIKEVIKNVEEIKFNGVNITDRDMLMMRYSWQRRGKNEEDDR